MAVEVQKVRSRPDRDSRREAPKGAHANKMLIQDQRRTEGVRGGRDGGDSCCWLIACAAPRPTHIVKTFATTTAAERYAIAAPVRAARTAAEVLNAVAVARKRRGVGMRKRKVMTKAISSKITRASTALGWLWEL